MSANFLREKRDRHDNDENNYWWSSRTRFSTDRGSFVMCCNIVMIIILLTCCMSLYTILMGFARPIREIRTIWSAWFDGFARGVPDGRGSMSRKNHIMLYTLYFVYYVLCIRTGIDLQAWILHLFVHYYYLL